MVGQRVPLEEKRTTLSTHVETLVARWKSRGPPVDTRALHARKVGRGMVSRLGREPSSWEGGKGEGGWGDGGEGEHF